MHCDDNAPHSVSICRYGRFGRAPVDPICLGRPWAAPRSCSSPPYRYLGAEFGSVQEVVLEDRLRGLDWQGWRLLSSSFQALPARLRPSQFVCAHAASPWSTPPAPTRASWWLLEENLGPTGVRDSLWRPWSAVSDAAERRALQGNMDSPA